MSDPADLPTTALAAEDATTLRLGTDALAARAMDAKTMAVTAPAQVSVNLERTGDFIGRYRLITELGEGGFGTVWRADQSEPIHREVALKVIKPGMDSREIIARFEAERQALALMDHPNIAGVLDAGTTDNGRPFFVMELVKGVPITDYCDAHQLTIRQRLELFIPVCQAVQHAHQKAILHRDLKPSNILVTEVDGKPVPKVIDFGIAKALHATSEPALHATLVQTLAGMIIGTPQYMSPEQAGSVPDVDTRSDIYTLGVILYELLVGETPLSREQMKKAALDEVLRLVREGEPRRPSSKFTPATELAKTTATLRHIEPRKLSHALKGDLDWIVLKALEKDRTRRYDAANDFALDLRRHLDDQPVSAGPPSASYRLRKLVKRNKAAFIASATIVACLAAGIIAIALALIREKEAFKRETAQRKLAEHAQTTAVGLIHSMLYDMRDKLRPLGRLDLLDHVSTQAEKYFENLPEQQQTPAVLRNQGVMYGNRGNVLMSQGRLPEARTAYEKYVAITERLAKIDPGNTGGQRDLSTSYNKLGYLAHTEGNLKAARASFEKALAIIERFAQRDPGNTDWQRDLSISYDQVGALQLDEGDFKGARVAHEKALAIFERLAQSDPGNAIWQRDVSVSHTNVGHVAKAEGDLKAARASFEKALAISERLAQSDPRHADWQRDVAMGFTNVGGVAKAEGDVKAARTAYEKALAMGERLAQSDLSNATLQRDVSVSYDRVGAMAEAEGDLKAARAARAKQREFGRRLVKSMPGLPEVAGILGYACLKEAEVLAKLEPDTPKATLQAILEEGSAPLQKLKDAGKLPPKETGLLDELSARLEKLK